MHRSTAMLRTGYDQEGRLSAGPSQNGPAELTQKGFWSFEMGLLRRKKEENRFLIKWQE